MARECSGCKEATNCKPYMKVVNEGINSGDPFGWLPAPGYRLPDCPQDNQPTNERQNRETGMYIADVNYYGQTDEYGITIDGVDKDSITALNDSGLQEGDRVEIVPEGTLAKLEELETNLRGANLTIEAIERLVPNRKAYRDLPEAVEMALLHNL